MAIPSFVDYAVTSARINVLNNATQGSNSYLSGSAGKSIGISPSVIATPDVGDVVLAQADRVVHRTGVSFGLAGNIYRGSSVGIRVTDSYYDDQVVTIFVDVNAPATNEVRGGVVDVDKRVYWS